ncbi:MAG TPA: prolipoprotein diacylglyceryl transferase family protein [Trebonia sp.]|jgi:prolipoprotein diacylglyceryltransferase|nr:prolipoprotein diacylglyceryl transferase family protein [Trebonia sp.]
MPLAYIPSLSHASWRLGPVPARGQALFIVAGIILAIVLAERRYRAAGGRPGVIMDIAVWAVPAGLIPAVLAGLLAPLPGGVWQGIRTWDEALGYPGAAALGTLAAWAACRHWRRRRRGRYIRRDIRRDVRLREVAGAVAPAMAFGYAVAALGGWAAQENYGRPSSLWWAVAISPAHRLPGYENFATFQPVFLYLALWEITAGIAVIWASRRLNLSGDRAFALQAAAYAAGGFALFWLGIGHLPVVLGLRAGELGDAVVLAGAVVYLARTRRRRTASGQTSHKSALERDSPVM